MDGDGRVHAVLRGAGSVVVLDPATGRLLSRRYVCAAPRGIAYDARMDGVHVACAGGELVTLAAATQSPIRQLELGRDLRDVVVAGDTLFVTRFRSAQVLALDASGSVRNTTTPPTVVAKRTDAATFAERHDTFAPAVAWRAIPSGGGGVTLVHQRGQQNEITGPSGPVSAVAAYYGGGGCGGGIVHSVVSTIDRTGAVQMSEPLVTAVLPVDIARSPDGRYLAIATAATPSATSAVAGSVQVLETSLVASRGGAEADGCNAATRSLSVDDGAIAVAFDARGRVLVQTREPARLAIVDAESALLLDSVSLSTVSREDTGHEIFHMDSGAGLACASCHAEGQDDGLVWTFSSGRRRTQVISGGVLDTLPLHWSGDMSDFGALMSEVFVTRMGGAVPNGDHVRALSRWVDTIASITQSAPADAAAVDRGRALFESASTGCASCHSGTKLTNNANADVGTGAPMQVPSLRGVAFRAPYLHSGCAPTLRDRFGACGGGDAHGHTSQLGESEIGDLVSYLEAL